MRLRFLHIITYLLVMLSANAQLNTERMMSIGRNALYFDDYVLSIQYFNLVINAKPHLFDPYYYRALAKFYLEDYHGCELDCTHAITRNPYYPNTYSIRGLARINMGKTDEAVMDYSQAIELEPGDRGSWHNLVLCHIELDSLSAADSICDVMLKKWSKYTEAYNIKSQIKMQQGDTIGAEFIIDQALAVDPYNINSLATKAQLLMVREAYAEAETNLTEALRLQPKSPGNLINRALSRYHQNNYRGAMKDYDLALELNPQSFIGHYNRGLLRANVGENNLAIEDFNFIINADPSDMMAVFNRATLLDETGDYAGAIRDYTTVINEYPKFLLGYQKRAVAKRKVGDIAGAKKDEQHVLHEQTAHRYGYATATNTQQNKTRKQSEQNLDDYNKIVVADEDEKHYDSAIRGKVQNRETEGQLIEPDARTYYKKYSITARAAFDLFERAYDTAQNGSPQESIELLTLAIDANPDFAEAYFNRGLLELILEDNARAIPDLSKAGELGLYQAYNIIKKNQQKPKSAKESKKK